MATFRRRKTAKGRTRVEWRVTRKGHRPIYGTCPTMACAKLCAGKAEEDLLSGRDHDLRVDELLRRYAAAHLREIPDSAPMYRRHLKWWTKELGDEAAVRLQPRRIAEARERLRSEITNRGRERSEATINRFLNTLSSAYSWASSADVGLVDHNPVRSVRRVKERPRVRFLSRPQDDPDSEIGRLFKALEASESPTLRDLVIVLLSTACRVGEVLQMEVGWVRLKERGFSIPADVAKTDEPRFVPLSGEALEIIRRRVERARLGRDRYIWPGLRPGTHAQFPASAWRRLLKRARITNFRAHDLRHTAVSYLVMSGKTLLEAGQQAGHKTAQSTVRYAHLSEAHGRKTSEDLAAQIDAIAGKTTS